MSLLASLVVGVASITGPNLENFLSPDDYPQWALREEVSTAGKVELLIDPGGRVQRCRLIDSVGSAELAEGICKIVQRRKVQPARDANGPVHGAAQVWLKTFLPDTKMGAAIMAFSPPADVILSVNRLPAEPNQPVADIHLMVEESGSISGCISASNEQDAVITSIVCSAKQQLGARIVLDTSGKPVRYVTKLKVRLEADSGSPN